MERAGADRAAVRGLRRAAGRGAGAVAATLLTLRDLTAHDGSSACASTSSPTPATNCARRSPRCSASSRPCRARPHDDAGARDAIPRHHARAGAAHGAPDRRSPVAVAHRAEAACPRPAATVDLAQLARHVADTLAPLAREMSVEIELDADRGRSIGRRRARRTAAGRREPDRERDQIRRARTARADRVEIASPPGQAKAVLTCATTARHRARTPAAPDRALLPRRPGQSRAKNGTGLGLAIVKHILTRHRGRLTIASRLEHGSTFSAFVPLPSRNNPISYQSVETSWNRLCSVK